MRFRLAPSDRLKELILRSRMRCAAGGGAPHSGGSASKLSAWSGTARLYCCSMGISVYPGRQTTGRFPGRQGRDPTCRPGRYHEGGRAVPSDICEKREISMRSVLVYRQTQQCVFGVKTNIFGPISGPGHVRASDAGRRGFLEANLNGKGQGAGVRSRKLSIGWGGQGWRKGEGTKLPPSCTEVA